MDSWDSQVGEALAVAGFGGGRGHGGLRCGHYWVGLAAVVGNTRPGGGRGEPNRDLRQEALVIVAGGEASLASCHRGGEDDRRRGTSQITAATVV